MIFLDNRAKRMIKFNPFRRDKLMGKKLVLLFVLIALVAVPLAGLGCGPEKGTPAAELVPQRASLVADVNLFRIFSDADAVNALNDAFAQFGDSKTLEDLVDEVKQETGIDLRDFSKAVIFGDGDLDSYGGAILKGDFDEEDLTAIIESSATGEVTTSSYKGYTLHLIKQDDKESAVCLLDGNTIALGTTIAVEDVIDVKEGGAGLSGPVQEVYSSMDDAWLRMAAQVPEEGLGDGIGGEQSPINLTFLQDLQAVGLSFDKSGQTISLKFKLYFETAEAATEAGKAIESLLNLATLLPDISPESLDMLKKISLSVSGLFLTVSLDTTLAEIESLTEALNMDGSLVDSLTS